jgi:DNA-binding HxlR family transcriptional regulator
MRISRHEFKDLNCPTEVTATLIGGKWKTLILTFLIDHPQRFGELSRLIPNVSKRILTLQLRELEEDGIIHREVYKQVPPRVEYSLTSLGSTLIPIIKLMGEWGEKYMGSQSDV